MPEHRYKLLIDNFLHSQENVNKFIAAFFKLWRHDRDTGVIHDERFGRLLDQIFTSCDCYSENPQKPIEISETELRKEVSLLSHIWWG